jgi:hypothetical protein
MRRCQPTYFGAGGILGCRLHVHGEARVEISGLMVTLVVAVPVRSSRRRRRA